MYLQPSVQDDVEEILSADSEQDSSPSSHCGVLLTWCGDPQWMLEVWVDSSMWASCWSQQLHGDLHVPMTAGEHECCLRRTSGETAWEGRAFRVVVAEGVWGHVDTGVLSEKIASDPQGRSQFSFDGGQVCECITKSESTLCHPHGIDPSGYRR